MDKEDDDFGMLNITTALYHCYSKHTVLGYDIQCLGTSPYNSHKPFAYTHSSVISVLNFLQGHQQNCQITVGGER